MGLYKIVVRMAGFRCTSLSCPVTFGGQCGSRTVFVGMKKYKDRSLSWTGEDLEIQGESQLSRGKCDNSDQIAQLVEHWNSNLRNLGLSPSTAVHSSHLMTCLLEYYGK